MKIQSVSPGDARYDSVNKAVDAQRPKRIDYKAIARKYNNVAQGTIILIGLPRCFKMSNTVKTLHGRGLVRGLDYTIARIKRDSNGRPIPAGMRPVAIKKQSSKAMR